MTASIKNLMITVLLVLLPVSGAFAIDPPHDGTNGISCGNCHNEEVTLNSVGYNNLCQGCHAPGGMTSKLSLSPNDASNIFGSVTSHRSGTIMQNSHNWGADQNTSLTVPKAGAVTPAPTSPLSYAPLVGLSCARCHDIHLPIQSETNSGPFLRMRNDRDQLCLECHSPRQQTSHTSGTHPVTMTYSTAIKKFERYTTKFYTTPLNANPANPTSAMKLNGEGALLCTTCHGVHYSDSSSATFDNASSVQLKRLVPGDGNLLRTEMRGATPAAVNICTSCHKGKTAHNGKGQNIQCADCHGAHVDEADGSKPNVWLIRRFMVYSTGGFKGDNRALNKPTFFQSTSVKNYWNGSGVCQGCHSSLPTSIPDHSQPGANCNLCHSHNSPGGSFSANIPGPHFSSISGNRLLASYVTSRIECSNCHTTASNNSDIRASWKTSGHANTSSPAWSAHDFKLQSGCVQCHTTTGFIAYSSAKVTAAWGSPSDPSKEVLACNGCHTNTADGSLRSQVPVTPYLNDTYINPNAGPSNICAGCHSGTVSGRSIKSMSTFETVFDGSHYLAASGVLFKSIGYEYSGRDYRNKTHFKHDRIGINGYTGYGFNTGSKGPCIACHMSTTDKHTFSPVIKDASGNVTALTSTICAGCHTAPAYLDAERMNSRKLRYRSSLLALQMVLESKGIIYKEDNVPYFFTGSKIAYTSWGTADAMGAAFNLHLLTHEPGAYAHNMIYAKRLIYDSIDYMDDGVLNNSVVATINSLAALDATQKSAAVGYLTSTNSRP